MDTSGLLKAEPISDEEVARRVLAGETGLFEIIMRRHNRRLYRVARSILHNDLEAEDVMQDAYVRAYEHLGQFDGRAAFATWLTKIAVYEALGRLRRRSRVVEIDIQDDSGIYDTLLISRDPGPEQTVIDHSLHIVLEAEIERLPQIYRSVFMLREIEKLSTAETAECMEISEDAVKVRLHRARALLRKALNRQMGEAVSNVFDFMAPRCDKVVTTVLQRISSDA